MDLKVITDKSLAESIFLKGSTTNDRNAINYTLKEFNQSWNRWMKFFVLWDNENVVGFSGIRNFGEYARILDRYFIMPEYRAKGIGDNQYNQIFVPTLVNNCHDKVPFFSVERSTRRRSIQKAIDSCNEVLPLNYHFHLLDEMYETAPRSWQNIAIRTDHNTLDLKFTANVAI